MSNYSQKERDLIEILEDELGFAAMRCPASGGATSRDLPDVLAGRPTAEPTHTDMVDTPIVWSDVWAFEVKYRTNETCYCSQADRKHLVDFAEAFGAKPAFAIRWNANQGFAHGDTSWYVVDPDLMPETEKNLRINYDEITTIAPTLRSALQESV